MFVASCNARPKVALSYDAGKVMHELAGLALRDAFLDISVSIKPLDSEVTRLLRARER